MLRGAQIRLAAINAGAKTMLKDIIAQAWEAMLYNRRRTAITMVGMAWGIATVVLLVAYGAGFSHAASVLPSEHPPRQ